MQTFLPYPDFHASAGALDPCRLGKQRVEALRVLRALIRPTYGWKRHPAVRAGRADIGELPPRLGRENLHRSHRSALLRKDPEWYRPVFGDVPDDLPYVWPASDREQPDGS